MAFNQHRADAADKAQFRAQAHTRSEEKPEEAASTPSNAVQNAFAPRSSQAPASRPSAPTPAPVTSAKQLSHREETLIKTVAVHKKWTEEQIKTLKHRMTSNPQDFQKYIERLETVFKNEIEPTLKRVPNIQEWVAQNPNAVAFQFETATGEVKNQALPTNHPRYEDYKIYHGVRMKNVSSDETPFLPPSELFRAEMETTVAQSEEAFEEKKALGPTDFPAPDSSQSVAQFASRSMKM